MAEDPRRTARTTIEQDETTLGELWLRYCANGGEAEPLELEAYMHEVYEFRAIDLKIFTLAIKDLETDYVNLSWPRPDGCIWLHQEC